MGRLFRPRSLLAVGIFAALLTPWDLGQLNVPWLVRLTGDLFQDSAYLESWFTTLGIHLFLFGSLFTGGLLSRPPRKVLSVIPNAEPKVRASSEEP